jgi:nitrogen fixation protein NifZ
MNISRDSDVVELDGPPAFDYGSKVRSRRTIRNDGTFPGKDIGDILVKKGDEGYVVSIGTFLQQFYIYGIDFPASGYRVGMKRKELEAVEAIAPMAAEAPAEAPAMNSALEGGL